MHPRGFLDIDVDIDGLKAQRTDRSAFERMDRLVDSSGVSSRCYRKTFEGKERHDWIWILVDCDESSTDGRTDRRTNEWTDVRKDGRTVGQALLYRDASTHLKSSKEWARAIVGTRGGQLGKCRGKESHQDN